MDENLLYIDSGSVAINIINAKYSLMKDWDISTHMAPFWRFYLPMESGGVIVYKEKEYPLTPYTPLIIPPYTNFASRKKRNFKKVFCHFTINSSREFISGIYDYELPEHLSAIFKYIVNNPEATEVQAMFTMTVVEALSRGVSFISPNYSTEHTVSARTAQIIELMKSNLSSHLSNKEIGKQINMAENSMVRYFRQQTGTPPQKYYMKLRLEHACKLLILPDFSINEIAEKCGFWDRNHFTKTFSAMWHCPPAEFRIRNKV